MSRRPNSGTPACIRLCCLGSDERFLHSLLLSSADGLYHIESRSRPFDQEPNLESNEPLDVPIFIRTELPGHVQDYLGVDPPVEIFAMDAGETRIDPQSPPARQEKTFSKLCIYSRKNVFVLELAYATAAASSSLSRQEITQGIVAATSEPFEQVLSGDAYTWSATSIIRVRPAPTHATGFAVLSPPGSLAMLTYNSESHLLALVLYHAGLLQQDMTIASTSIIPRSRLSTPLEFAMEEVLDESHAAGSGSQIVDFCFAASNELALVSSLTVLLIKGSGDILAASPVVFHGTVVKTTLFEEALEYIQEQKETSFSGHYKWNQCRAAEKFLAETFTSTSKSRLCTANLFINASPSALFPLQVPGPVLYACADEPGPPALTIEKFGNTAMVGVACGMEEGQIDFAIISPTALLPRFSFESKDDFFALNDAMMHLSCVVDRVALGLDTGGPATKTTNAAMILLQDPVLDHLLHVCTKDNVSTISSKAVQGASRQMQGCPSVNDGEPAQTSAWPCINGTNLQGIAVSGDAYAGHEIIAQAGNGQLVCVSVAQAQTCHDFDMLTLGPSSCPLALTMTPANSVSDEALRALESTPPMHEFIAPLVKKIEKGLSGLSRFVGSETMASDITPEQLAVAIKTHEKCYQQVVLPLLELKKAIAARKDKLKLMMASQREQLAGLVQTVSSLKNEASAIVQDLDGVETNASIISERSTALLQASKDLVPTITKAEYDYFQYLKRAEIKCGQVEADLQASLAVRESLKETFLDVKLDSEQKKNVDILLSMCGIFLTMIRNEVGDHEKTLERALGGGH